MLLQKFLDEKLSKKVVKDQTWKNIDFQEFLDSIERKAATANLELLDIELPSEGLMTSLVTLTKGNPKKKSTSFVVVCDQADTPVEEVTVTFNKELKKVSSNNLKRWMRARFRCRRNASCDNVLDTFFLNYRKMQEVLQE